MPLANKIFYTCIGGWGFMSENNTPIAYITTDALFSQIVVEGTLSSPYPSSTHLWVFPPHPQNEALLGYFD